MVFSPDVGTGLMPLISASTVSLETQANWVFWLQSIFDGSAVTDPLTGATTTVALAMPALKRWTDTGNSLGSQLVWHDEPRVQGLIFSFPFEILTMTRWSVATVSAPYHNSLP